MHRRSLLQALVVLPVVRLQQPDSGPIEGDVYHEEYFGDAAGIQRRARHLDRQGYTVLRCMDHNDSWEGYDAFRMRGRYEEAFYLRFQPEADRRGDPLAIYS